MCVWQLGKVGSINSLSVILLSVPFVSVDSSLPRARARHPSGEYGRGPNDGHGAALQELEACPPAHTLSLDSHEATRCWVSSCNMCSIGKSYLVYMVLTCRANMSQTNESIASCFNHYGVLASLSARGTSARGTSRSVPVRNSGGIGCTRSAATLGTAARTAASGDTSSAMPNRVHTPLCTVCDPQA